VRQWSNPLPRCEKFKRRVCDFQVLFPSSNYYMNALMRRVHSVLTLCALRLFSPSQKTSVVSQGASGMGCLKSFFWLSFGISLYVLALLIFAHGFLLTRHEMAERSTCQDRNSCWVAPELNSTYKRAIIVIIDALRFDFAAFTNETTDLPYINKLPVFHDMAREKGCSSAQLFRYMWLICKIWKTEVSAAKRLYCP